MIILITGSRSITDINHVFSILDKKIDRVQDKIIHGGASGADSIAEAWCKQEGVNSEIIRPIFPSKREYYLHRNAEMIGTCDKIIAFWDKKSRGTDFTIRYARKRGKKVEVY